VWKTGKEGLVSLYVNGERAAVTACRLELTDAPAGPLTLGSDRGTNLVNERSANGVFDELTILKRALTRPEVRSLYRIEEPNWKALRVNYMDDAKNLPPPSRRDSQGRLLESRAILDEGANCLTKEGTDRLLDVMTRAGLNVYIPCLWHGKGALFQTDVAPPEPRFDRLRKGQPGSDPLTYLLNEAHKRGFEVHPWFCVTLRQSDLFPQWAEPGTPGEFFDAQHPEFRRFIVDLILDLVKRYPVDGVNLDYIRTGGLYKSATAQRLYKARYQRDLLADAAAAAKDPEAKARVLEWQAAAIDDIVRRVREATRALRPKLVISTCGHPRTPEMGLDLGGRNDRLWVERGWIDVAYDMDYSPCLDMRRMDALRASSPRPQAFAKILGDYDQDDSGKLVPRAPDLLVRLADYCRRKYPGAGLALYIYSPALFTEDHIRMLKAGPFREPAVPSWPRAE